MENVITYLTKKVEQAKDANLDLYDTSWEHKEGVLISYKEADDIVEGINSLKVGMASRDYTIERLYNAMILDSIAFANWITRHATEADECDKWYRVDIAGGITTTDYDEIITTDVLYDIYRKTL